LGSESGEHEDNGSEFQSFGDDDEYSPIKKDDSMKERGLKMGLGGLKLKDEKGNDGRTGYKENKSQYLSEQKHDRKYGDQKERRRQNFKQKESDKSKPVDFQTLVKIWREGRRHPSPSLRSQMAWANNFVYNKLSAIGFPWLTIGLFLKTKFKFRRVPIHGISTADPIGALLQLVDSPMGGMINPKELIDFLLRFPPLQTILKAMRATVYKALEATSTVIHDYNPELASQGAVVG